MNDKVFDSGAEAKLRFPDRVFCWGDYITGPFGTYQKCADEYARARSEGPSYVCPPGVKQVTIAEYEESKKPNRERPTLNIVAQKCRLCNLYHETCPVCYAAWWKKRHPSTELNESHEITYAPGKHITLEIDDHAGNRSIKMTADTPPVELPKMPSELLLLARDPLMGKALGSWILLVQDHYKQSLLDARKSALINAAT